MRPLASAGPCCWTARVLDGGTGGPGSIRTAVAADLPELKRVFRAASLSNPGEVALLSARPELLVFRGEAVPAGRTRVATAPGTGTDRLLGFATVVPGRHGEPELDDLFVDPPWHRRGVARRLVADAVRRARADGAARLWVTANRHAMAFYLAVGFIQVGEVATELAPAPRLRLDLSPTHPA